MNAFLLSTLILLLLILVALSIIARIIISYVNRGKSFLNKYFGTTDLKQAIEKSKIDEENTPRSISSMDSICIPKIKRDFPEFNVDEFRRIAENSIIYYLNSIEHGMIEKNESIVISDKVAMSIKSQISDYAGKNVHFDSIRIHRTAIKSYTTNENVATIVFNSSVEYMYSCGDVHEKLQTRYSTEFVYVIDTEVLSDNAKGIGLNCPNCGAPIKSLGYKHCDYCGTGVVDIIKRNWILNDIKKY